MWFYDLASKAMDIASSLVTDRAVIGRENVPREGPLLVVSNHLSLIDPPLLGAVFPRCIYFMAKEELFHVPALALIVSGYGAYPVRRGEADRQALRTTLSLLQAGQVVGIFPEGTRSDDGVLAAGHPGAALVALKADVPIVPVGIAGSEQVLKWPRRSLRPRLMVRIGQPFRLEQQRAGGPRESLARHTEHVMAKIAELLPPQYRQPGTGLAGVESELHQFGGDRAWK